MTRPIVTAYQYHDERKAILYENIRYEPKDFRLRRPDDSGGYTWNLDGVRRVPYRLPEMLAAIARGETIHVVEGEKDAATLANLGLCATTSAQGASWPWPAAWSRFFAAAKQVIVLCDCDKAGREAAQQRASIIAAVCDDVRMLDLDPARRDGYDISNWVADGHVLVELRALADAAPRFEPNEQRSSTTHRLDIVRLADVTPEQVDWLWRARIPRGKVTLLVGDPGAGKSFAALAIAASITNGTPLPGDDSLREPGNVLLWNGEDGIEDTIRVRADAVGVNLDRIHVIRGGFNEAGEPRPFSLGDVEHLGAEMRRLGGIRMVVIDPVSVLLAGVDTHRDAEVRSTLQPLVELARSACVAVLVVLHLRKGEAERIVYRVGGSIGFVALARSVLLVGSDEDGRRAIAPVKANLCAPPQPVEFRIDGDGQWWWGKTNSDLSAEHLLAVNGVKRGSALRAAIEFFEDALANGERDAKEVIREADALSIPRRTQDRARKDLRVKTRRVDGLGETGKWVMWLPKSAKNARSRADGDSGLSSGSA